MRINLIVAGAMASVLALGAVAPALADNDHRDRRQWREDRREDRREYRHDVREARRDYERDRRDARRDWRHDHGYRPAPPPPRVVYRPGYRPGPGYGWQVGHRYRDYYRGPVYVVNDYPRYHLRRPPYGHQWIRDDRGNMLLVAIATGVIAQYVLSR
ncbi:RcnB family protein [Stenotrophomonas sp.]|uniref:RcnB family protein n=1 Tax=Stenotrophomonas sp. TaxID=69392 RepID=UPI002D69F3CA|nr:RcnB family protein [Stenotrophomonas sp.]HYQ22385.1 RcnB family protein [Stenotrophomonas sp.]